MFRVVIAEDELPILRGLKNMIEKLNPRFQVVMTAKNGKEAIEYLEEHPADVLFTDINMPIADGFEVLKFAAQGQGSMQCVVISGYNEFVYAQRAIKYQAKRYLLKPIEREELKTLLEELQIDLLKQYYERKHRALTDIIFGQGGSVEKELFKGMLYPCYFCAGSFTSELTEELSMGNGYLDRNNLRAIAKTVCPPQFDIFTFWGKRLNEMLMVIEGSADYDVWEAAAGIIKILPGELPVSAACLEGKSEVGNLKDVCFVLRRELKNHAPFGRNHVLGKQEKTESYLLRTSEKSAFQIAVKRGQREEISMVLAELKKRAEQVHITQKDLECILNELFFLVQEAANGRKNGLSFLEEVFASDIMSGSCTLNQVFEDFQNLCIDIVCNAYPGSGQDMMKQVDDYIRKHIAMPLTTKMLAARFGLVAPYLSRLFKDYKGVSPSQYIQNIRIQDAKELLVKYPDMLAKDIAETVGYNNPLYFSKIFKRLAGMYPSEYRLRYKQELEKREEKQ